MKKMCKYMKANKAQNANSDRWLLSEKETGFVKTRN